MTKHKFLMSLQDRLSGLPQEDVEERLNFYSEMIDDRMEEGRTEEEAVAEIGSVDEIAAQIAGDNPLAKMPKEKTKQKKRFRVWEIVLLVLGSPIWLSLLIAAFAVILSLYIALWSLIISLWAVFVSFIGCALGGIVSGIGFVIDVNVLTGIAMIGVGIVCTGLSVFTFFGCRAATMGTVRLTGKMAIGMKNCFVQKEKA